MERVRCALNGAERGACAVLRRGGAQRNREASLVIAADLCVRCAFHTHPRNTGGVRPQLVDSLESHGVSATDVAKLKEAGFHTVESVRSDFLARLALPSDRHTAA